MPGTTFSTISTSGKAFVDSSGNRFVVRGVALSASGVAALNIDDILADAHHDLMKNTIVPTLVSLNVNCIRVYQVDPANSHAKSMALLQQNGIYVMVGLATPTYSVKQMTGEYSYGTFLHATKVVDEFQQYANTLCFSVGNEVEFPGQQASNLNATAPASTAPSTIVTQTIALEVAVARAMKSFSRDIKAYMTANSYRSIPVGAAMQDGPQSSWTNNNPNAYQVGILGTDSIAQYYAAGTAEERMDFIGINTYRYQSGATGVDAYDTLAGECEPLPIPVFLTETGALATPRTWAIVPQMYTDSNLYPQLSGQVAFQLLEEGAGYGLYDVSVDSSGAVTLTASKYGGAAALSTAFGSPVPSPLNPASTEPANLPTAPSSFGSNPAVPVSWPSKLLPQYTILTADTSITVENSAAYVIQITQMGTVLATVPAGSQQQPVSQQVNVYGGIALSIQAQNGNDWDALCGVAAANVVAGITVKNDVTWGVYTGCNVDLPAASPISITVNNYATTEVNVVINGTVIGTVEASSGGGNFVSKSISTTSIGELNIQENPSFQQICSVPALLLQDNVTIENNLGWGLGCNLPVPNSGTIPVKVENYSTKQAMKLVQSGNPIVSLPVATSSTEPSSTFVSLSVINDLYIQYEKEEDKKDKWINVCQVPSASISEWMNIGNNVATYGDTCVISCEGE